MSIGSKTASLHALKSGTVAPSITIRFVSAESNDIAGIDVQGATFFQLIIAAWSLDQHVADIRHMMMVGAPRNDG